MAIVQYFIPRLTRVKATAVPLDEAEDPGALVVGEWDYPRYSFAGLAYRDYQGEGVFNYPTYAVNAQATEGAPYKPPLLMYAVPVVAGFSALPLDAEDYRISQPAAGVFNYPGYSASGRVEFVGVGVGSWDYPSLYSAEGVVQQNGAVFGEWDYPGYTAFGGAIDSVGKWSYPGYSIDGVVAAGNIGDWQYPGYSFEGGVVKVPDNAVMADFEYPRYEVAATGVQQNAAKLVANYWSYSASGRVDLQYATGVFDYPTYGATGLAAPNGVATGDWQYPGYSASGEVDKYGFEGELNYPGYSAEGFIGFPGVGVGIWRYALGYSVSGLVSKVTSPKRKQFMVVKRNGHD